MMFRNDDYGVQPSYITFVSIFWLLRSDCIADLIKKLELCLTAVSVLLKIRFGYVQIGVKIANWCPM